jgi:hypothetical protein
VDADMFRNHVQEARPRFNCENSATFLQTSVVMVPSCYRAQLGFGAQRTTAAAEEKMAEFVF